MNETVFLRQVIKELEKVDSKGNSIFHEIEYRTFNTNNKSGGALKKVKARLLIKNKLKGKVFDPFENGFRLSRDRKNPNHWLNVTRNLELEKSGLIRKVKIRYITKFNGVEVVY